MKYGIWYTVSLRYFSLYIAHRLSVECALDEGLIRKLGLWELSWGLEGDDGRREHPSHAAIVRQGSPVPSVTMRFARTIGRGEILIKHEVVQDLKEWKYA